MNYTQAQIDRANAVSLEDFLRTQGETLIKSGREYRWKEHDSLTIRGNKWFRHSQSKGGYRFQLCPLPERQIRLQTGCGAVEEMHQQVVLYEHHHIFLHWLHGVRSGKAICRSA